MDWISNNPSAYTVTVSEVVSSVGSTVEPNEETTNETTTRLEGSQKVDGVDMKLCADCGIPKPEENKENIVPPKKKLFKKRFSKKNKSKAKAKANVPETSEVVSVASKEKEAKLDTGAAEPSASLTQSIDIEGSGVTSAEASLTKQDQKRAPTNKRRFNRKPFYNDRRYMSNYIYDTIPVVLPRGFDGRPMNGLYPSGRPYGNNQFVALNPNIIPVTYQTPLAVRSNYSFRNNNNSTNVNINAKKGNYTNTKSDITVSRDESENNSFNYKSKNRFYKQQYRYLTPVNSTDYYGHNPFPKYYHTRRSKENRTQKIDQKNEITLDESNDEVENTNESVDGHELATQTV